MSDSDNNTYKGSSLWLQSPDAKRRELIVPSRLATGGYISDEAHAEIARQLQSEFSHGFIKILAPIPFVSTASDEPAPELDGSIVEKMMQTLTRLRKEDPLLQRGIELDWVCVVHPALVHPIEREFPGKQIGDIMGRRVWQVTEAPRDRVEYMPFSEMIRRYASTFQALAELAKDAVTKELLREFVKSTMQARRAMADAEREQNNGQGI
jgi:hypothetical protein